MKKILVIEDERSIRESILDLLEAEGFQAFGAENGTVGIQKSQSLLPDLILCDVIMPGMDGYQVLAALRRSPVTATIPLIFLTAMGAKEDIRQGMELGADDYLSKPCSADELIKAIATRFEKQALLTHQSQQQLDSLRSSIALSLPHELRTPLNGIMGLAELLINDYEQVQGREILEIAEGIYNSAERLHRLIQNFLLYAELEIAMRDPDRIRTLRQDVAHFPGMLIMDVAQRLAHNYRRQDDLTVVADINHAIQISDLKFSKIVEELLDNAFKFSRTGTSIHLVASLVNQKLVLAVTNEGRGMTTEQIAQQGAYIQFERKFYEQQGTGLGLAIARRLVELYSGELDIYSISGQQLTVQVILPLAAD